MTALIVKQSGETITLWSVSPGARANPMGEFPTPDHALNEAARVAKLRRQTEFHVDKIEVHPDRDCITCGKTFSSEGPHNRLCDPCRISTKRQSLI